MFKPTSGLARTFRFTPVIALVAGLASGCLDVPQPASGAGQEVAVAIAPSTATVTTGGRQIFVATVTGTADTSVTWQIPDAGCGTVTSGGVYTAPASAATCHVVVTSSADPTRSATSLVTVQPPLPTIAISVSPSAITVPAASQTTFSATVTGTTDTAVTWLVQEAGCGTVTAGGVYTAPAGAATCHLVASSHADPTRTAVAAVTVTGPPPPVVVSLTPGSATAFGCQTASFSATVTGSANTSVTWSVAEAGGGTVSATGVYTAPSTDGTYHVVATSVANPASSASAAVVVTTKVLSVAVSPANVSVPASGSVQLTATVTTTCGATTALARLQAPATGTAY